MIRINRDCRRSRPPKTSLNLPLANVRTSCQRVKKLSKSTWRCSDSLYQKPIEKQLALPEKTLGVSKHRDSHNWQPMWLAVGFLLARLQLLFSVLTNLCILLHTLFMSWDFDKTYYRRQINEFFCLSYLCHFQNKKNSILRIEKRTDSTELYVSLENRTRSPFGIAERKYQTWSSGPD